MHWQASRFPPLNRRRWSSFSFQVGGLTAALVLNASPAQMGLLAAFEFAPFLLLSLLAGVWVDRWPRRPVLIVADAQTPPDKLVAMCDQQIFEGAGCEG